MWKSMMGMQIRRKKKLSRREALLPFIAFLASFTLIMSGYLIGSGLTDLSFEKLLLALSDSDARTAIIFAIAASTYGAILTLSLSTARGRRALVAALHRVSSGFGYTISTAIGVDAPRVTRSARLVDLSELREMIEEIDYSRSTSKDSLSQELEKDLLRAVEKALSDSLDERFDRSLQSIIQNKAANLASDSSIKNLQDALDHVKRASSTVTIRGFLNLLIGVGFALTALYFLKESIEVFKPEQFTKITTAQISYIVGIRLSLTLVITAISYFFLSLYKKGLDETKYYQNEITFLSGKISSISMARSDIDKDLIVKLIDNFADIDRNRIANLEKAVATPPVDYMEKLIDKLPALKIGS